MQPRGKFSLECALKCLEQKYKFQEAEMVAAQVEASFRDLANDWGLAIPGTERHMQQDRLVAHSIELVVNMQKMYQASPPEIFDALATVLTCMLSGEQSPDRGLQEQCGALMHALDSMRHRFKQAYVTE